MGEWSRRRLASARRRERRRRLVEDLPLRAVFKLDDLVPLFVAAAVAVQGQLDDAAIGKRFDDDGGA